MTVKEQYNFWLENDYFDEATKAELKAIKKARTQELKEFLNLEASKKENITCTEDDVAFLYEGDEDGRPR